VTNQSNQTSISTQVSGVIYPSLDAGGVEKLGLLTSVDSARKRKLPPNVHVTRSVAREQGIKIEGFYKEGSE
jgi:hypothetical protein